MALTGRSLRVADVTPLCRETQRESQAVGRNAASICAAPLAVFLPAGGRGHWFARGQAGGAPDAAIAEAICALAMTHTEGFVEIPDLLLDERFVEMELVASSPWLRSFAGVPLEVGNRVFGAICVFDFVPKALSRQQRLGLEGHARGVAQSMERQRAAVAPETPRTQADRQAALSSAALANARDAVLIFSLRSGDSGSPKIAYANDAFARMTGTDALAALGGPATSIAPRLRDADALDRAAAAGLPLGGIVTFPGAGGTTVEAEMTVATMPSTGGEHHWVAVLRDPSGRYRAERGEREAFAAGAHRAALAIHEDRMRALFDRTPAIVFTLDRDLRIRSTLGGGLRAIGFTADSAIGTPIEEYLLPAQCDAILTIYRQVLTGKSASYEHAIFNRTFQTYVEPSWDEAGRVDGVAAVAFDVTDRELAKRALAASHEHLARTERTAQVGSWLHDVPGDRLSFSDELVRLFSVGPDASREALFGRVVADDLERARLEYAFAYASMKAATLEYRIAGTKAPRWIRETIEFATDDTGRLTRVDGIVVDITDRRSAEAEIARLADTDDVTGLPNRAALATRIDRALFGSASGDRSRVKLLLVDLDRFQATADAFGRKIGDRLLREAARRLTEIARDGFVARLDGHGFAVLFAASDDAARVAKRLHGAFRSPFEIDAGRYVSTVSVGIASGEPKETADDLLRRGESTLAAAKLLGGNRTVDADDEAAHAYRRRKAIDLDLRGVLDRNDLHLVFQPIVNVRGKVTRLEALLRWNHEIFGAIAPSEFVPIAEENGEIVPIGRWVLRTACRHLRNLRAATGSDVRVAVNVSPAQFSDPTLMSTIGDALESAGLEPEALEIEITESTVMSDPLRAAQLLTMIRATGVTVSIDDFGTGYSSLASLQRLPIDSLKIDKSFIAAMPEDAEACAIVDAILALARQLSLEVVAEGVETVEQAAFLRERGCPLLQGFYFARPDLPATMLTLARHPDDAWTSRGPALASPAVAGTPDGDVRRCHLHVRTA